MKKKEMSWLRRVLKRPDRLYPVEWELGDEVALSVVRDLFMSSDALGYGSCRLYGALGNLINAVVMHNECGHNIPDEEMVYKIEELREKGMIYSEGQPITMKTIIKIFSDFLRIAPRDMPVEIKDQAMCNFLNELNRDGGKYARLVITGKLPKAVDLLNCSDDDIIAEATRLMAEE